jgi:type VI secretion system secreted protein Hcp
VDAGLNRSNKRQKEKGENHMAFDAYLKLDTITGESTSTGYTGCMEIFNFSLGAANPVTIGSASTGGGGGKAILQPFSFTKKTDSASPNLYQSCVTGAHLATGTVTLRKAGGGAALPYLTYGFKVIFIESVSWSGSTGGDDSPTEHVSAAFGTLTIDYQAQSNTGTPVGGAIHGGWNVQTNTAA